MIAFFKRLFGITIKTKNGRCRKPSGNRPLANRQRQPLDFDPLTPKIRKQKKEEFKRKGFRTAAVMVMGVSLVALGNTAVQETLFKNPRFSLRHVYVDTSGMLSPTRIITATGLTDGVNLLTVNLRDVREHILRLPGVRGATVQRDFDGKLTITVDQRKPIAWVRSDNMHWVPRNASHGMLVDEEAVAIPAETVTDEMLALPEISIDSIQQGDAGSEITEPKFQTAFKLLRELIKRQEEGGATVKCVETSKKFALIATFRDGATTTFSIDNFDAQLDRYDAVLAKAREGKFDIEKVNVIGTHMAKVQMKTQVVETEVAIPSSASAPANTSISKAKVKTAPTTRSHGKPH